MENGMTYDEPVKPESMALLFVYICPYCQNEVVLVSPRAAHDSNLRSMPQQLSHSAGR